MKAQKTCPHSGQVFAISWDRLEGPPFAGFPPFTSTPTQGRYYPGDLLLGPIFISVHTAGNRPSCIANVAAAVSLGAMGSEPAL
jgi:hypothetical protein